VGKHKDEIGWDLVTLQPPFVRHPSHYVRLSLHFNPGLWPSHTRCTTTPPPLSPLAHLLLQVPSASSLNTSNANFLALLKNDPPKSAADLAKPGDSFIDVRDVAWAHAEALVNDRVAGKSREAAFGEGRGRVALSAGAFSWQDVGAHAVFVFVL
jgi:hypothetical protein